MLGPCWHYVGSFFALGHLFFSLERLSHVGWAFFYSRSTFFLRFGWLRVGCLGIQGQFRGSEITFLGVLSSAQVCNAKKIAHVQKPQFFLCFSYCELCLQATKQRKIIPGACSTELPAKIALQFRLEMDSEGV